MNLLLKSVDRVQDSTKPSPPTSGQQMPLSAEALQKLGIKELDLIASLTAR